MLSLRHPNLQTIIQTRVLSDKLDTLQIALTGASITQAGIAKDQAMRDKVKTFGQVATVAALSRIDKDVDDMADGFFGED